MNERKSINKKPIASRHKPAIDIAKVASDAAKRLIDPDPRELYYDLLEMKNHEGGIVPIENALSAAAGRVADDPHTLADVIEDEAVKGGADAEGMRRLFVRWEDAYNERSMYREEAAFLIGFECGARRARGL